MSLNPDVERIQVVNTNGQVLFDTAEGLVAPAARGESARRWLQDRERLEAVKKSDYTLLKGRDEAGAEILEIVAPYLEEWGRHELSVVYQVSYRNLEPAIAQLVYTTGALTVFSMVLSVLVAVGIASRITRPVEVLTAGAKDIADGHLDRHLDIRSHDELGILASTFNHMTDRLRENVEELEESNQKLAAANDELKELDRMKSDLLANVSHELRTPLTAIKGYTDYMLEGKLGSVSDKQEKGLLVVQRNLERLSKSINALLDFSRMEVGRIALNIQPFSLQALAEQIQTTVRAELERKRLVFEPAVDPSLPPVIADREKLAAVIENLVINAIKFTPEGGRITVGATRSSGRRAARGRHRGRGHRDRHPRGPAEPHLQPLPPGGRHQHAAVRRGRPRARHRQEHPRGARGVDRGREPPRPRHDLPLHAAGGGEGGDAPGRRSPGPAGRSGARAPMKKKILIVDDEEDILHFLELVLREKGYEVATAMNGHEALTTAQIEKPDLVLLDIMMPQMDGWEVLKLLRVDDETANIPVAMLSARTEAKDRVQGLQEGAIDYICKPFSLAELLTKIETIFGQAGGQGGGQGGGPDGDPGRPSGDSSVPPEGDYRPAARGMAALSRPGGGRHHRAPHALRRPRRRAPAHGGARHHRRGLPRRRRRGRRGAAARARRLRRGAGAASPRRCWP